MIWGPILMCLNFFFLEEWAYKNGYGFLSRLGLISTQPFIQGKTFTHHQIAILRQKAQQQQQQQQQLKLQQQQQQRLQQQKQLKLLQQQQVSTALFTPKLCAIS